MKLISYNNNPEWYGKTQVRKNNLFDKLIVRFGLKTCSVKTRLCVQRES